MAKIVPFRAVRYNLGQIPDPGTVMAPPYDVISPVMQDDLYQRSPYNVVRLILGKIAESDTEKNNRYTRSADDFAEWQRKGILTRDSQPAIYLYDQEYQTEKGETVVRKGFIALTRIEDFSSGVVKPHEKTLAGPKTDRLNLTKACRANFSPIFSLYSDPCCVLEALTRKLKEEPPTVNVTDDDGIQHRLWQVSDTDIIHKAQDLLDKKPLFIADGHHRYETALNFRNYMREKKPNFSGKETFNFVLMYFANMEDQGMQIFPTHRLIYNLSDFDFDSLLKKLEGPFQIETQTVDSSDLGARAKVRGTLEQKGQEGHALGLYAGQGRVHFLTLRDDSSMDQFFDSKTPKVLRTLDVSILHRLILEEMLDISLDAQEKQTNLKYVKNFDEPFEAVDRGEFQLAFLMNATRMGEVRDVANAGEKMPQKSTYFYPKLLTGLVVNKIVDDESVED